MCRNVWQTAIKHHISGRPDEDTTNAACRLALLHHGHRQLRADRHTCRPSVLGAPAPADVGEAHPVADDIHLVQEACMRDELLDDHGPLVPG